MEQNITMQQLKQQRMTPAEKFVLGKIKGAKAFSQDKDGTIAWHKDGEELFFQDFKYCKLWSSSEFWFNLTRKYKLNHTEKTQLLAKLLHKYTNNGQLKIIG